MTKNATVLSDADVKEIVRLYSEGMVSYHKIAGQFRIRGQRCRKILIDNGIKIREPNDTRVVKIPSETGTEILSLYKKFPSIAHITKATGYNFKIIERFLILSGVDIIRGHSKTHNVFNVWKKTLSPKSYHKKMKEYRHKMSVSTSGERNGMYDKPSPTGSGNGWKCWYKGIFFRSLKELGYFINEIELKNKVWERGECQKFTIDYNLYGKERTYRPDFFIDGHTLVEIKPIRLHKSDEVKAKSEAAISFCKIKGWNYLLVDFNVDYLQIKRLYLEGLIKPQDKYRERFESRLLAN